MDILITLLQELAKLSGIALYIGGGAIVLLFAYKVAIIGSIYSLVKYCVGKVGECLLSRPVVHKEIIKTVKSGDDIRRMCIKLDGAYDSVLSSLRKVAGVRSSSIDYIHDRDAAWLAEAIEEKKERDKAKQS